MKTFLKIVIIFLPWRLRRMILIKVFRYKIDKTARIGWSYIYPDYLEMGEGAHINHLTVAIHLHNLTIEKNGYIGRENWITGFKLNSQSEHFAHQKDRDPSLYIGNETNITNKHHIDCTNTIRIGDFTTIAGYSSQLLTHSINIYKNRQESLPITIGNYCFVSSGVIILGGSALPDQSLLAAGAVLNKQYEDEWTIYGGVPAVPIKHIDEGAKYFSRDEGYVI